MFLRSIKIFLKIIRIFTNKKKKVLPLPRNFDEMNSDYTDKQQKLARYAKALGNPTRVAIMEFLLQQKTCFFGDIHEQLPIAKATASQHLSELKDAGLI